MLGTLLGFSWIADIYSLETDRWICVLPRLTDAQFSAVRKKRLLLGKSLNEARPPRSTARVPEPLQFLDHIKRSLAAIRCRDLLVSFYNACIARRQLCSSLCRNASVKSGFIGKSSNLL